MSSGALRVRTLCVIPGVFVGRLEGLSYLQVVLTTFKRNHDKNSYYLKFSAIPLRGYVKLLSRHTRWVADSSVLSAYRFLQRGRRLLEAPSARSSGAFLSGEATVHP